MKESYGEGLAIHAGPESCVGTREGAGEALTGERAGWVLSCEIHAPPRGGLLRGADVLENSGRPHRRYREGEMSQDLARSETPRMHRSTPLGNREVPLSSAAARRADRIGKSQDARR